MDDTTAVTHEELSAVIHDHSKAGENHAIARIAAELLTLRTQLAKALEERDIARAKAVAVRERLTKAEAGAAAMRQFIELVDLNVRAARAQVSGKRQSTEEQEETHLLLAQVMNALNELDSSGGELLADVRAAREALEEVKPCVEPPDVDTPGEYDPRRPLGSKVYAALARLERWRG